MTPTLTLLSRRLKFAYTFFFSVHTALTRPRLLTRHHLAFPSYLLLFVLCITLPYAPPKRACSLPLLFLSAAVCFMCFCCHTLYHTSRFFCVVCLFYALHCHTSRPSTAPHCLRSSTLVSVMFYAATQTPPADVFVFLRFAEF